MKKTVTVPARYSDKPIIEDWELTQLFCPCCGTKGTVWCQKDEGDYYVGEEYFCTNCHAEDMYLDSAERWIENLPVYKNTLTKYRASLLEQLKSS